RRIMSSFPTRRSSDLKEMVRLQATRSMVGSQCFASNARKLLIGSLLEKLAFGEEKRRSVETVVAAMRYAQYTAKPYEIMLHTRPDRKSTRLNSSHDQI